MIEGGLHRAIQIVSHKASEALNQGEIEEAKMRVEQAAAIKELEEARKAIFDNHGVPDIEHGLELVVENDLARHLSSQPFHEVLKTLMMTETLSASELSNRSGLSRNAINQMVRGVKMKTPSVETLGKLIEGFGWEADDWRTHVLLTRALKVRRNSHSRGAGN